MATKIFKMIFLCIGIMMCLDVVLPAKKAYREISDLQQKARKLSGNYIIVFKDNFECHADLDESTLSNLNRNEPVTVKSTRFTKQCVYIEKNGVEIYRESHWRILFLFGAFLCIGYGIGKINPESRDER
ncbi:MAG: hypothetical protein IPK77_04375 [Cellvibrio sp.]|nr:hypothetical protein [Cellvibrio sp.]